MSTLIERLEKAGEGSRELDAAIEEALVPEYISVCSPDPDGRVGHWVHPTDGKTYAPHYTTSIDETLPRENIVTVMKTVSGFVAEHANVHQDGTFECFSAEANTEPLARRTACLRALEKSDG